MIHALKKKLLLRWKLAFPTRKNKIANWYLPHLSSEFAMDESFSSKSSSKSRYSANDGWDLTKKKRWERMVRKLDLDKNIARINRVVKATYLQCHTICFPQPHIMPEKIKKNLHNPTNGLLPIDNNLTELFNVEMI